ncbi:hypothetical protein, partial [Streptomyces sp. NPDC031705]|uniref:hypothetical protein n=1 Tax=Streptomyces sp. NPDC031705 TaxID=3155729 RepID=UPI0033D51B3D
TGQPRSPARRAAESLPATPLAFPGAAALTVVQSTIDARAAPSTRPARPGPLEADLFMVT